MTACKTLPEFDSSNLESVMEAFSKAPAIALGQFWLPQAEPDFLGAEVRLGRVAEQLLVLATIPDVDIFTRVTEPNQRTWELGDVFEIFLKPESERSYREFHVTPANIRTQLGFSAEGATPEVLPDGIFESRVWIESGRWIVLASIPCGVITNRSTIENGERWRFSFCRYDAFQDGRMPVLSSTSPHPIPKFHRHDEWGILVF
jgi:hypothetical protein